jgi:type VI protein secretion system component Hcp
MPIEMKYEGIDGESTLAGKTGFISVASFNWGLSRTVSAVRPGARARTEPAVQEVIIRKATDGASVALVTEALFGRFDRKVDLHFLRPGIGGDPQEFVTYHLFDCGISSYGVDCTGDTPLEVLKLNFAMIQFKYIKFGDDLTGTPSDIVFSLPDPEGA